VQDNSNTAAEHMQVVCGPATNTMRVPGSGCGTRNSHQVLQC